MARKNPFASLMEDAISGDDSKAGQPAHDYTAKGASRSMLSSITEMATQADRLVAGETIVEIDPEFVDISFVKDRLDDQGEDYAQLVEAIRERGQDSPILVRPHPSAPGRFMIVFGHRRVRVARDLGRKVRAVVKNLADIDHVIAQGQENSARANLSFIEKALYAGSLAALRYDDDNSVILTALSINRPTLSKMLSVASLPSNVLEAIGPAKAVGRDRWYELKQHLDRPTNHELAAGVIGEAGFVELGSDERFDRLIERLKAAQSRRVKTKAIKTRWQPDDKTLAAEISSEDKRYSLAIKGKGPEAREFGHYLTEKLSQLYQDFRKESDAKKDGV